jgi:hAT family C-terminal dimerisation region
LQYKKSARRTDIDEFEEFLKLPQENFAACDPVQWWAGCCVQFPNLSQLARDIMSIPGISLSFLCFSQPLRPCVGSAIAVERVFSGGRDTICLCHARLKADTIHTLMVVKQRLCLARMAIGERTGDGFDYINS